MAEPTLSEILNTSAALVKSHRIDSDGEQTTFRTGQDLKELLSLGVGLTCAQKKNVMAGVFGYRGVAQEFPSVSSVNKSMGCKFNRT